MSRTHWPKRRMCSRMSILPNRRGLRCWTARAGGGASAIHSLGIVLMSILGLRIRAGLKRRRVAF
jgi:hypothetical protein